MRSNLREPLSKLPRWLLLLMVCLGFPIYLGQGIVFGILEGLSAMGDELIEIWNMKD